MSDPRKGWTSASSAQEDLLCPGRHLAQQGIPDDTSRPYTEFGARVHDALCGVLDVAKLDLAEREMFDLCREQEKKLVIDYFGEQPPAPVRVVRKERLWVQFEKDGKKYAHSGEPDVIYRCGTKCLVPDYKTGRGEVEESPMNLQLRDYAVLVSGNLTLLDEITTAIIQPSITSEPKLCGYYREALEKSRVEMYERIIRSNTPGQPRVAGEIQCKYCLAKKSCVEYQQWSGGSVPMLRSLDVPMTSWTPEQRAAAAAALGPARKFLEEIEEYLKANVPPGWMLKPGNKVEKITDPQKCLDRFTILGGKLPDFMPAIKVVKGELRAAVSKVTGKKGKSLDKVMTELTDGIVEVNQNAPSLKPAKEIEV